jgi:hypothetical protein
MGRGCVPFPRVGATSPSREETGAPSTSKHSLSLNWCAAAHGGLVCVQALAEMIKKALDEAQHCRVRLVSALGVDVPLLFAAPIHPPCAEEQADGGAPCLVRPCQALRARIRTLESSIAGYQRAERDRTRMADRTANARLTQDGDPQVTDAVPPRRTVAPRLAIVLDHHAE